MAMRENKLHALLAAGKPTIGTHIFLPCAAVVEQLGHAAAFDYVEFLAEYTAYDQPILDELCRAAELHDLGTMIKLDYEGRRYMAQRAVGSGFEAVLFADLRTPDDVTYCVNSVRPDTPGWPGSVYGAATRRNALPLYANTPEYVQALEQVVVAIMVEKREALERLDELLAVPGVAMVQWGPADYAMSIGAIGDGSRANRMREVERTIIEACARAGVHFRAECSDLETARYYADLGVRHFCFGWDLMILLAAWRDSGTRLRDLVSEIAGT